jgi:iron complex outermembrane recepter protein
MQAWPDWRKRLLGGVPGVALFLIVETPAVAQDQAGLDPVIVYAQKRATPLNDVPMSVSTLTDADLADAGIHDIEGVATSMPNLDMQRSVSPLTTTLRIRRVGSLGNIPTFEPAVGLFVDGAYRSRSLLGTGDLLDVDHIEVLSGPQTSLYGRSVSAGVVSIYTRRPDNEFRGDAELTGGVVDSAKSAGMGRVTIGASGPLSETLGGSIAAAYSGQGLTFRNALPGAPDGNDLARTTARGQLLWSPSERFELRLIAGYLQELDAQGESDVFFAPGAPSTTVAGLLQQQFSVTPCPENAPHNSTTCSVATNLLDLEAADLTMNLNYRLANDWTISSLTGWDRYEDTRTDDDVAQLFAPLIFYRDSEQGTSIQQELRLASADNARVLWLAGLSFYANEYRRGKNGERPMFGPIGPLAFIPLWESLLQVPLALPGQLGIHDSGVDTDYYSVFGQATWALGKQLSVTGSLRWQTEEKRASINNSVTLPGPSLVSRVLTPSVSPSGDPVNGAVSRSTDYLTWSVTPQYRFNDDLMAYLTVASGGKSGGFNTGFGNAPLSAREFGDETTDHFEVGARASFADSRVHARIAAFHTEYHDYQDAAFISAQFLVGNANRVELKGAELEGSALLGAGTTLNLAVSFADLTYGSNTTGVCHPGRAPDGSLPGSCDLTGEHPIDAPPWMVNASLQRERPVSWGSLFARIDASWNDQYNTSASADPRLVQKPRFDIGVRLGASISERYECVLWVDNLLDEKLAQIDAVLNLFNDASYQSFMSPPRTYGVTLRMRL